MSKYFRFNPIQLFSIDLLGAAQRLGWGGHGKKFTSLKSVTYLYLYINSTTK